MKISRRAGATSQILQIFIADSSSATGAGLTGLTNASAGLTAYYHRDTDTTATAISLVTMTVGTFTSSGFKEIDSTNMPGWYQLCPPNAALASGAASVGIHLKGATNMAPLPIEIDLDSQVDVYLWNGTAVSSPATAGIPDVNVKNINNVAAATPGASGGILIAGTNAATTIDQLTLTGTAASGSTPATAGLIVTGGAASTTGGGTAAPAATFTGGSGAASTNGAAAGMTIAGGGTNTVSSTADALTLTATSNGNGMTLTHAGTGKDLNATTTPLTLAKTTNITGFNDITAAQAATGVWQDTTAGDFTVASSIGKSLYTSGNAPGAASGIALVGSNMGTVSSVTGNVGGSVASVIAAVSITSNRKKGSSATFEFLMQDASTGAPKIGLTVAMVISKDGGVAASTTNSVTEIGLGQYQIVLTATEMTANNIFLQGTATGALTFNLSVQTAP